MATTIPQAILKQGRKSGVLNLSNRNLESVPDEVWRLNVDASKEARAEATFDSDDRWWEQVELTKLNLSSNQLVTLSEQLSNFRSLTVLDLHDNKLVSLPASLGNLSNLKRLDLSHNSLKSLPSFESLENVFGLLLHHNQLVELPASIASLINCELLDVSQNLLENLPDSLTSMKNLRSLNISNNCLTSLPSSIGAIHSLTILNLNDNKLKTLPETIGALVSLQQLYLRNNSLAELPSLKNCDCLKEIYAGNNALKSVPTNLPTSISILELRDNKIDGIDVEIICIQGLERLDIANNNISKLPPEIGNLQHMKALILTGNPLRSIRRDVINQGTQAIMKYLRTRIVPPEAPTVVKSQEFILPQSEMQMELSRKHVITSTGILNLSKGNVTSVENGLEEASGITIKNMDISRSVLQKLPFRVFHFSSSLVSLNVSFNKLAEIPSDIGLMQALTHLNLSSNMLNSLPDEITSLTALIEINICSNKFSGVPPCVCQVGSLEHLLMDGNQLVKIDVPNLNKLSKLLTLSMQNNSIEQVPPEVALIGKLQTLKLEGNLFRVPRQQIMQKGSAAVLEYLRSRVPT